MTSRAVIFANGEIAESESLRALIRDGDMIIAADGGLRHVFGLGLRPNIVVGDLDSAPNELVQLAQASGAEIVTHPVRKDKTDLELALETAIDRGATGVVILGALGGRLDHALANILLLSTTTASRAHVRIVDVGIELTVVDDSTTIEGGPGDAVTLLALTDTVTGITTDGLEYPLTNDTLERGSSRGVSNVMTGEQATASIASGLLLTVHEESR
ncbi:MAG TPA: thiamine diphosphokinase [Chloroflexota bacterium]|jgi:thiamine pyrophosphokinase|nr:thiamine diphosphokinase [Chloroflexota bacterium]